MLFRTKSAKFELLISGSDTNRSRYFFFFLLNDCISTIIYSKGKRPVGFSMPFHLPKGPLKWSFKIQDNSMKWCDAFHELREPMRIKFYMRFASKWTLPRVRTMHFNWIIALTMHPIFFQFSLCLPGKFSQSILLFFFLFFFRFKILAFKNLYF